MVRPLVVVAAAMFILVAGCTNAQWAAFAPPYWLDADGKVIPQVLMHERDHRGGVERYRPDIWNRMFRPGEGR